MPIRQLKLTTENTMFGTNVKLTNHDKSISYDVGKLINFDPTQKLAKRPLKDGYLFRSPRLKPEALAEIWPTIEGFDGDASFSANIDTKDEEVTAYMKIADKVDATTFAFTHSLFEKWSDEKEAAAVEKKKQKKKIPQVTVDDQGNMKVQIEVETLDTPDPD
jgi:hypothetical protein